LPYPVDRRPIRIDEDDADDDPGADDLDDLDDPDDSTRPAPSPRRARWLAMELPDDEAADRDAGADIDDALTYPIPPTASEPERTPAPAVPTWAFRAPAPALSTVPQRRDVQPQLDPLTLRRRVTIRSGTSSLTVDEAQLVLRAWWRRREIPWSDVSGFEPRYDPVGAHSTQGPGRLVALTAGGPVDLPATKRSGTDLNYLHALLEAYRQRAVELANR
jgi:hypothetical protein